MTQQPEQADPVADALSDLRSVIASLGRDDLERRTSAAAARMHRSSTVVCVVGEFKQGKSSLVNGLLGRSLLPVDDDLATSAITLLKFGDGPVATVVRREDGALKRETVEAERLTDWVSEVGNPGNGRGVERVEVSVPAKILQEGLILVDTPGMGGLGAGHAAATQAFLPFADGLILVSDSSSELSATEIELMQAAVQVCPTVMFVQTKTDLFGQWRKIFDLNRAHLERAGLSVPMLATSAALRMEAFPRNDRDLNALSGYPGLITTLVEQVVTPAKASARQRAVSDIAAVISLLRGSLDDERQALTDPAERERALEALQTATQALEKLRGPGAKWQLVLNDGIGDLSGTAMHRMRGQMRSITDELDERIDSMKTAEQWDSLSRELQTRVADAVAEAFNSVVNRTQALRTELIELIADENLAIGPGGQRGGAIDITRFWKDKAFDGAEDNVAKKAFNTGFTGMRGAQGGVMMFGMLGRFLPAAAGVLLGSTPVLLAAGAAFGGRQLLEDRKRKVTQRQQQAKSQMRKFIDNTQFEISDDLSQLIKEIQREIRDEFSDRLGELQRTYSENINQIKRNQQASDAEKNQRLEQMGALSETLARIEMALSAQAPPGVAS